MPDAHANAQDPSEDAAETTAADGQLLPTCADAGVFVSHATGDRAAAEGLVSALEARGRRCWIATRDIPLGANYAEEIVKGIGGSEAVVVVLSQEAVGSRHVRREVNLGIDMGKPILPLSLEPGIRSAGDLPGDWNYWLGLVQIYAFSDPQQAAAIVDGRMAPAAIVKPPVAGPEHPPDMAAAVLAAGPVTAPEGAPAPQTRRRGAPTLDDRIRSTLIQAGASGLTFAIAVQRGRRVGATPEDVEDVAYRLRDGRLLSFDGDLSASTIIRLT